MTRPQRGVTFALLFGGAALLVAAGVTLIVGRQYAGYRCMNEAMDRYVTEERQLAVPEGYSVGIPELGGVCRIERRGESYREIPLDRWDADELATAIGLLGAGAIVAGAESRRRQHTSPVSLDARCERRENPGSPES